MNTKTFRSKGNLSCRNCSEYGEVKKKGTTLVLENDSFFCLHCYRILEGITN